MGLSIIVLAGGTGSRMYSKHPKVLHRLAGMPLLEHVLRTVQRLSVDEVFVVYGHMGEMVQAGLSHLDGITWVEQAERLGTGHAVQQVLPHLTAGNQVLILYGDVPLISEQTLSHLVDSTGDDQVGLLTAVVENPHGLGRIIRDEYRQVHAIVEERDATDLQKQINEINTGIYCLPEQRLSSWLAKLSNDNAQGEYYLTDVIKFAHEEHVSINVSKPLAVEEIYGTNNREELARLENIYQSWQASALMAAGVSVMDPARIDIRGEVIPARDCTVDVNVLFEGRVELGEDCYIGPGAVLKNVKLGQGVTVRAYSIIEDSIIEDGAIVGPFARVRPESVLENGCHIGNFVEVKKSRIGAGSKVNHLSYVGDSDVGENVNVGAGTITCNYDGAHKHKTVIEDDVFVGSDTQLVAPVKVEKGATIGAGTTVTKDVAAGTLVISRAPQKIIEGWRRPVKEKEVVES